MVKYKRLYAKFFGYGIDDWIPCEICGNTLNDVHHILPKGMGGTDKDHILNLMGVCRDCHDKCDSDEIPVENQFYKHVEFIMDAGLFDKLKEEFKKKPFEIKQSDNIKEEFRVKLLKLVS